MFPGVRDYRIAWVLPSSDQQAVARDYFDHDIVSCYSSTCRVTYTFGRVEQHKVVMASPASNAENQSTDYIIEDLLRHVPSIRAGFLVSSDAVAPRAGIARVGDVVVGGTSPNMERGVIYLDAEKAGKEKRIRIIGASQTLPATVVKAVREAMNPEGRKDWEKRLGQDRFTLVMRSVVSSNNGFQPDFVKHLRQALIGVIASSKQGIEDTTLLENIVAERDIICFETQAATMCSYPFLVVTGISKYCDNV
ncbi:hypothetical protein PFICI_06470 [Pestalotiopsis fici W106-1]|uniref:Uncharacterized protein n=1 Tax=Pestalotiopsis fici (strain W106-1 / CGMCC3.15140) TaxID=1229662 RepID=W3X5R0_PESFW|nr:uncharacterized protein PFICI_06470 [Pestalotiopsis fici W106-1]ETS81468.1 hypothetical protein PFICI_06470 [Pestalotiopsis fici W106-1]